MTTKIQMKCENCGGDCELDAESGMIVCKFCGMKTLIKSDITINNYNIVNGSEQKAPLVDDPDEKPRADRTETKDNPVSPTEGKSVNKVLYGILAILFGALGIHKYYGGRIGLGIVYLLFCWTFIPGILGIVEGIMALCKKSDGNGRIVISKDKLFA